MKDILQAEGKWSQMEKYEMRKEKSKENGKKK